MQRKSILKLSSSVFLSTILGGFICALFIFTLSFLLESRIGATVSQLVALLIYFVILYGTVWGEGSRDKNRASIGRIKEDKFRGLKVGLIATIPLFLCYIALLISRLGLIPDVYVYYKILNVHILPTLNTIQHTALVAEISWIGMVGMFLLTLITPLITFVGYYCGYQRFSIMEKVIYKKKSN